MPPSDGASYVLDEESIDPLVYLSDPMKFLSMTT